jgi:enterochelin esterase-like enzyme
MKVIGHLTILILLAGPANGQEALTYGSTVTGDLAGGESHTYTFSADAGDLISGQAELVGPEGFVEFRDGVGNGFAGMRVQGFYLGGTAGRRVGLVAPASGTYQVRIVATGAKQGRFTLRLERLTVATRMHGVSVTPKDVSSSERIRRLATDVQQGRSDAVIQFWNEVEGNGPLIEPIPKNDEDVLVTFLWREIFETHNVLVGWPMAVFRADDYYMSHLPNTNVWFKTIQIRRGSTFTYWLSPNDRPGDFLFTARLDPLNRRVFPDDPSATQAQDRNSVFERSSASDERWYSRIPGSRGVVTQSTFASGSLKNTRDIWVYTPPGYSTVARSYPLLLLFDGPAYVSAASINAPSVLDNLINEGRIRPVVVCFLNSVNRTVDLGYEGVDALGDAIVRELLPKLRATYAITTTPRDVVIGGSSQGGLAAALIALKHASVFGNVLSQSGAFRFRAPGTDEANTISQRYAASPAVSVRFYLETGLYENVPSAGLPLHDMVLDEGITGANRHFRDVLVAKGYDVIYRETPTAHEPLHWRATLADGLIALLRPSK